MIPSINLAYYKEKHWKRFLESIDDRGCFTCIIGESYPTDDYEIDLAIKKRENKKGHRHIDEIEPKKIAGFFDDDGYEINTELIKKPSLCLTCINDDNPSEELLCN